MARGFARLADAALIAALVVVGSAVPAYAQNATSLPTRNELNPAERTPDVVQHPDLFSLPAPGPCPLASSTLTVEFKGAKFSHLTGVPAEVLSPPWQGSVGRTVPLSDFCAMRDRIAELLFKSGILARVEIPEQRIDAGIVTFEVVEARVMSVRVTGDAGPVKARIDDYASKLRGMNPFNLAVAQRYLLLASDLPGIRLRTIVRPAKAGGRGAVDIEMNVTRNAFAAVFNTQNYNSRATGRFGALARVDFNSLTEAAERTSVIFYHTVPDNEQFVGQLLEELRIGGDGLLLRGSIAYGETRPGAAVKPLNIRSISTVGSLELAYPLIRLRRETLTVAGGVEAISQKSMIQDGGGRFLQDDLRIAYIRGEYEMRPFIGTRQAVLGGELTLRKGVSFLGASHAGSFLLSRADGKPDAFVVRASARALLPLADKFTLFGRLEAQVSPDALLSYEELPIGTLTIGRGYDPASASGDSGIAGSFEGRFGPFALGKNVLLSPYGFFDIANVSNKHDLGFDGTLSSAGAGAQLRFSRWLLLDLAYAKPFDRPAPGFAKPSDRVLVNLTVAFE